MSDHFFPPAIIGCAAALVGAAAAGGGVVLVRGSTAVPAAWWAVVACLAAALECVGLAAGGVADHASRSSVRLVVVALSLCPIMAILGAKRPQHGVWQFIVGSLAVVLALPALSAAVVRPGTAPDVHLLERGFVLVLLLVGWLNFVATRHGLAATLVCAGQGVWCREFLPLFSGAGGMSDATAWPDMAAAFLVAAGATLAITQSTLATWRRHTQMRESCERGHAAASLADRVDPPFLALKETLGAAWTLRIIERFNAVAAERSWPWRLRFTGLETTGGQADATAERAIRRTLQGLLRRFVTGAWLARHGWH
jgi:hypothetical protein